MIRFFLNQVVLSAILWFSLALFLVLCANGHKHPLWVCGLRQSGGILTSRSALFEADDVDSLIAAYAFVRNKPGAVPKNPVPAHLPDTPAYTIDFSLYANLMGGQPVCPK